jgi:hypothetical protein
MATQTVTWTALPDGRAGDRLRFSVHVAPRLHTDAAEGTLADFPDWVDWPANLTGPGVTFKLVFSGPGLTLPPIDVTPLPLFDSARWTGMFPPSTLVRGHQFKDPACTRINSYPVSHVVGFLKERYGRFGTEHPETFPPYDELVAGDAFGPIGFEDVAVSAGSGVDTDGPDRRQQLRTALEDAFNTDCDDPGSGPDTWALPFVPGANQTPTDIGTNFIQVEKYLRRDLPTVRAPLPELEVPEFDVHELVAFSREYRSLVRILGLVLDFEVPAPALPVPVDTRVRVEIAWTPQLGDAAKTNVTPFTHCTVGPNVFEARAAAGGDLQGRLLRVGDPDAFEVVLVDADGGAVKAMQFADNVTRSRLTVNPQAKRKRSLRTPEAFALPALGTGGLAVARRGRANLLAHTNQRSVDLNGQMFLPSGDPAGTVAELFLDHVTRGYRWDVLDEADGRWRSLMWRTGSYSFLDEDLAETDAVDVTEEASMVTAVGTSGAENDPGDLYLPETMARWRGWSLGARQVGKVLEDGELVEQHNSSQGVRFEAHLDVLAGSLPRLRFGRSYRFRARAVDIAGNSLDHTEDTFFGPATATTRTETFRRFEPVEAPRTLLRHRAGKGDWTTHQGDPGAGAEWVVVRSESAASPAATTSQRHVVPPRSTQQMAEWHGRFDLGTPGMPIDAAAWADIAARAAASLEALGTPEDPADPSSFFFDVNEVPIEYLPDPLARRAFLRGLPPNPDAPHPTESYVAFEGPEDPWPKLRSFRLVLQGGPDATWAHNPAGRTLTVTVPQGDIYRVAVGCNFDRLDTDLMALWPWLQEWAAAHGMSPSQLRTRIDEGRHWMFTPARTVTLVHAVRTPLKDPVFVELSPSKAHVGATAATFESFYSPPDHVADVIECSRKSTSKLEITGSWQMPVDRGPNSNDTLPVVEGSGDDPTVLRDFSAPAFTLPVDRAGGDPPGSDIVPVDATQEFGDTKFRSVTYDCKATSAFTEHFREEIEITPEDSLPLDIGAPYEPTTVKVKDLPDTGRTFALAADRGPFDPADPDDQQRLLAIVNADPPVADYVVDDTNHTIRRTAHGSAPNGEAVAFSFVRPQIHAAAVPVVRPVPSSARPAAPDVAYVLPAFAWDTRPADPAAPYTSTRHGGYLRVYLRRPWWSSGDGEKLGVVLWRGPTFSTDPDNDPVEELRPFVTMWGLDPVTRSTGVPVRPQPSSFPLATDIGTERTLEEGRGRPVDVAGHDVGFDFDRGLWYCDIQVTQDERNELRSYFPFIRLALARYQPTSIADCHLSRVVLADFIQLAPTRTASITGSGASRTVTLTGHSYVRNAAGPAGPGATTSHVRVHTEEALEGIPDEHLRWDRKPGHVVLTATQPNPGVPTLFVWTGSVPVPANPVNPTRLVVEEVETHFRQTIEAEAAPKGERVVHTDVLPLS